MLDKMKTRRSIRKFKNDMIPKEIIEKIEQLTGSVRLHIRFGDEIKMIDQKWLLRTKYQKS